MGTISPPSCEALRRTRCRGRRECQQQTTRYPLKKNSWLLLLSREHDGSEDGDEDQDGSNFEGEQKLGEEEGTDLGDVAGDVVEIAADVGGAEGIALGEEDEAEQAEDGCGAGETNDVGGSAAGGSLLFAGIQQHDDEDKEDHNRAGVNDHLRGGEELGPERPVEDGERHHHDNK